MEIIITVISVSSRISLTKILVVKWKKRKEIIEEPEKNGKCEGTSRSKIADCWRKSWRATCYSCVAEYLRQNPVSI